MKDTNADSARPWRVHVLWTTDLPAQRNRAVYQRMRMLAERTELHVHTSADAQITDAIATRATLHRIPGGRLQRATLLGATLWQVLASLWLLVTVPRDTDLVYAFHRHGNGAAGLLKRLRGDAVTVVADMQHTPCYYSEFAAAHELGSAARWLYRVVGALEQWWARRTLPHLDLVFALDFDSAEGIARILMDEFSVPAQRCCPLPNGVDLALAARERGAPGADADAPHLVFAGNLRSDRLQMMVQLLQRWRTSAAGARLSVCGSGGHAARSAVGRIDAAGFEYRGMLSHEALMALYRDADVALVIIDIDMRDHLHALPGKLFEALAMGLVVIATDMPAARRLIEHGRSGFLLPPGADPGAVVDAAQAVLADASAHAAMSRAAIAAVEELDWDKLNRHWWQRLQQLLG